MKFLVTIERDEDGVWVVECPAIPGCVSQGKTKNAAVENVKDAIKMCLEVRAERGLVPNLPTLLNMASEDNLILRTADGREYVLAEVDDFDREVALVRQNQELMAYLEQRSRPSRTCTIEETRKILEID